MVMSSGIWLASDHVSPLGDLFTSAPKLQPLLLLYEHASVRYRLMGIDHLAGWIGEAGQRAADRSALHTG
jgi:hypothetical protein